MPQEQSGSYWDAVRSWADSLGLLNPHQERESDDDGHRPKVPQAVCDNCPICQAAATVDALNPVVLHELTEIARSLIAGVGSALGQAAETRVALGRSRAEEDEPDEDSTDVEGDASQDPGATPVAGAGIPGQAPPE